MRWGRLHDPQRFYGYQDEQGTEVDIPATLRLASPDGQELPGLQVRMVPGQVDDVLVSAPDKDFLGWSRDDHPDLFELKHFGLTVPRGAPMPAWDEQFSIERRSPEETGWAVT